MIVGITGYKGSGKDVLASFFLETGFTLYKFASPIKTICKEVFTWDDEWVDGKYKEVVDPKWGISPRQAQQLIGTELFRETLPNNSDGFNAVTGNNVWVDRFKYWYESLKSTELFPHVVISDLRFLNEADAIVRAGGKIIRIDRPSINPIDTHASEVEMLQIQADYTIVNDSSIIAYEKKIYDFFKTEVNAWDLHV